MTLFRLTAPYVYTYYKFDHELPGGKKSSLNILNERARRKNQPARQDHCRWKCVIRWWFNHFRRLIRTSRKNIYRKTFARWISSRCLHFAINIFFLRLRLSSGWCKRCKNINEEKMKQIINHNIKLLQDISCNYLYN